MINAVKELLNKPVAYHPVLARMTGNVASAVMLSQGMYWQKIAESKGEEWFWVKSDGWKDQCGLSRSMQETAREVLRRSGFWFEVKRGIPAQLFFRIDAEILVEKIEAFLAGSEQGCRNVANNETERRRTTTGQFGKQGSRNVDDIEIIKENSLENPLENNKGEKTPFVIQTIEADENLKIETVEIIEIEALEESPFEQKTSPGRGAKKKPGEYSNQDVARNLDGKHQVFFAEVLQNGAWDDFLEYRQIKDRFKYKDPKSCALGIMQFYKACLGKSELAQEVVNQTRGNGWTGLFELKNSQKNATQQSNIPNYAANQRSVLETVLAGRYERHPE